MPRGPLGVRRPFVENERALRFIMEGRVQTKSRLEDTIVASVERKQQMTVTRSSIITDEGRDQIKVELDEGIVIISEINELVSEIENKLAASDMRVGGVLEVEIL